MYRAKSDVSDTPVWTGSGTLDDFAVWCCPHPHVSLLSDADSYSLAQRVGGIGPITVCELVVNSDVAIDCGDLCSAYRVNLLVSGRVESLHRGASLRTGPGTLVVYQPEGRTTTRWAQGSRIVGVRIDRCAVAEALDDALGRRVTSQIDFTPLMPADAAPTQSWVNMLLQFKEEFFRRDSLLNHPLVAMPFVDSLVRGLLLAGDHPFREAVATDALRAPPRAIRAAIEILEDEAHLPTTVSALAARTHVSVRSLQQGFRSHLGVSPMEYLREVRLRRAHQTLRDSDPSAVTVATVAYHWGFTNLGRFAAAHAERYGEAPSVTLRGKASRLA